MKLFNNMFGLLSYAISTFFVLITLGILTTDTPWNEKSIAFIFSLLVTLAFGKFGKWLMKEPKEKNKEETQSSSKTYSQTKSTQEQIRATFYRLIKANNGYITLMRFAIDADISAKEAQAYLDEQAKGFSASFEVNEKGDMVYRFPI